MINWIQRQFTNGLVVQKAKLVNGKVSGIEQYVSPGVKRLDLQK